MSDESELTEANIDRIRRLCAAATSGPWIAVLEGRDHDAGSSFIETAGADIEMSGASPADYDFVASARQDIPRLLDEVAALRLRLALKTP